MVLTEWGNLFVLNGEEETPHFNKRLKQILKRAGVGDNQQYPCAYQQYILRYHYSNALMCY